MIRQAKSVYRNTQAWVRRMKIRQMGKQPTIKLMVGAGDKVQPGWISAVKQDLDILKEHDWQRYFKPGTIDNILAEHVWEHLTLEEGQLGIEMCYKYLKQGGRLRLAVPDGFHPSPDYIEYVRPGGSGPGADDHKILYTVDIMRKAMESAGFRVVPLEYHDKDGVFHAVDWDPEDGKVNRSLRFDSRNANGQIGYTSLIVDGIRP